MTPASTFWKEATSRSISSQVPTEHGHEGLGSWAPRACLPRLGRGDDNGEIFEGWAQDLRLLKLSGDHQRATQLADQRVREVLVPDEQREHGAEAGFRWERVIRLVEAPELALPGRPPRWRVFEIAVRVTWDERRQVELATLRTVPAVTTVPGTRAALGQNPIPRGGGTQ